MEEQDGATVIMYAGDAQVGGTLASVGQRMVHGAAKMMATQSFLKSVIRISHKPAILGLEIIPFIYRGKREYQVLEKALQKR